MKNIMGDIKEFFKARKLVSIITLVILILGIPLGVLLIRQQQIFKSRAAGEPITFVSGGSVSQNNGTWVTTSPQIAIKVSSALGPPASQTVQSEDSFMSRLSEAV
ncbi:MAG: hypothetical protein Q8Q86_03010, partial [Candidatus Daviesbacteria bacterium]|nr:hypothetical protein [Candidatus Daviesbacteria bacterium]